MCVRKRRRNYWMKGLVIKLYSQTPNFILKWRKATVCHGNVILILPQATQRFTVKWKLRFITWWVLSKGWPSFLITVYSPITNTSYQIICYVIWEYFAKNSLFCCQTNNWRRIVGQLWTKTWSMNCSGIWGITLGMTEVSNIVQIFLVSLCISPFFLTLKLCKLFWDEMLWLGAISFK